jgi:hypothetical protein
MARAILFIVFDFNASCLNLRFHFGVFRVLGRCCSITHPSLFICVRDMRLFRVAEFLDRDNFIVMGQVQKFKEISLYQLILNQL